MSAKISELPAGTLSKTPDCCQSAKVMIPPSSGAVYHMRLLSSVYIMTSCESVSNS